MFLILVSKSLVLEKSNRHVTLELKKPIWPLAISFGSHEYKQLDEVISPDMTIYEKCKVTEIRMKYASHWSFSQLLQFSCPSRYITSLPYD